MSKELETKIELETEITSFVAEGGGQEHKFFSQGGQLTL